MPSRQPVGAVTASPGGSLFQAHKPREPALALPALRKGQTYVQWRIRLRVMLAASLNETLTEAARSSAPSALCRRSCALGSPRPISTPEEDCPTNAAAQ